MSINPNPSTAPKTRVQQMIEKTLYTDDDMTPAEELLDRQSGLFIALLEESDPQDIREVLGYTKATLQMEGLDLEKNLVQPVLATALYISTKYIEANALPAEQAGAILATVSRVFGVKPEDFTGTPVSTLAYIMERDFDIPVLEAEIRRFGFDVNGGNIGTWNGPATPATKPRQPSGPKPGLQP